MLFRFLPFFCVGIALSFILPQGCSPAFALLALALLVLSPIVFRNAPRPLLWLLVLAVGVFYGLWRTELAVSHRLPADAPPARELSVRVISPARSDERSLRFEVEVLRSDLPVRTLRLADYQKRDWPLGSAWKISARLRAPVGQVNGAGFAAEAWALSNGLDAFGNVRKNRLSLPEAYSVSFLSDLRARLNERILSAGVDYPRGAGLVSALSLGLDHGLSDEDWENFRRLGLTHVVSISGLHVSMVAFLVSALLWFYARFALRRRFLPVGRHPKIFCVAGGLIAAVAYAALAGFSVPTQRSLLMLLIAGAALCARHFRTAWQIWWGAAAAVLLFDPTAVLAVGTCLSFGLVAALIWVSGSLKADGKPLYKTRVLLKTQIAAAVASIVPLSLFFNALPMVSPLANIVGIPWFSAIVTPLSLLALLCPGDFVLTSACAAAEYTLRFMDGLRDFAPMYRTAIPPLPLTVAAICATVALLTPRVFFGRLWAAVILAVFVFYAPARPEPGRARITVYDVGQGLSVLMQTHERQLLFDTGRPGARLSLIPALSDAGVRDLDALVLSHGDDDHDGAVDEIRDDIPVGAVWAGVPSDYDFPARRCDSGITWQWDGVYFEWLTPYDEEIAGTSNDRSCVLRLIAGNHALLITGDLSREGELELVRKYGDDLYSQILILGHHGSKTSSLPRFVATVAPEHAIASAGFANGFHHPHPSVTAFLEGRGIKLWRTDRMGAIRIDLGGESPEVRPLIGSHPYWQQKPLLPHRALSGSTAESGFE